MPTIAKGALTADSTIISSTSTYRLDSSFTFATTQQTQATHLIIKNENRILIIVRFIIIVFYFRMVVVFFENIRILL